MRYRILASFQGAPYEAGVGPDESDVVLFAACPPPEALKFEPATGHWRKRVSRDEVQSLYESRPVGMFRGERCIVLDDLGDRLHIVYHGHDAVGAAELGYWEIDRGVFELITPRHEVTDIVEQRFPLPIRSDSGQHTRPGAMPLEQPDGYSAATPNGVPYSGADSQSYRHGADHDEFATGTQRFDHRTSIDGLPPSVSQDLPITGLSRQQTSATRPPDQAEVAIPPVPAPPLPLEAEALRAASSAVRRGQKSGQSRSAHDGGAAQSPQPAGQPQAQVGPVQAAPAETTIGPAETTIAPVKAAESAEPLPAAVPAAAMLSKAAMLSHAAATASRLAAASGKQGAEVATDVGLTPAPAATRRKDEEQGQAASAPDRTSLAPETSPPAADPAPLAMAEPASLVVTEPAPLATVQAASLPPESAQPVMAEAAQATGHAADEAAHVDQPATELAGISDPPSAAHPPASAVPSWIPQGPVQPEPAFGAAQPTQPTRDSAHGHAPYYAPYVTSEPMPRNGTAEANGSGSAGPLDIGLAEPMPIWQSDLVLPSTFPAPPEPLQPTSDVSEPADQLQADPRATTRRRRGTKRRLPTQKIFSDLATQAAIPAAAYAIGEDVDGAMCLVRTDEGFEVFNSAAGSRHEVRNFQDEESAYFYLFGVLVAESVRTGALVPRN